jgi:hypothetical protein
MKLADLRKLSVRQHSRIHFRLRNGMECVITEHGIASVPALKRVPDFNLEDELASAAEFVLEPIAVPKSGPAGKRAVAREELSALVSSGPAAGGPEHEDE